MFIGSKVFEVQWACLGLSSDGWLDASVQLLELAWSWGATGLSRGNMVILIGTDWDESGGILSVSVCLKIVLEGVPLLDDS